ncbi:MAG: PEP-CTERM sorting domain-containing protein [Puniceicoccaceae bacterium]
MKTHRQTLKRFYAVGLTLLASCLIPGIASAQSLVYDGFATADYASHADFTTVPWTAGDGWQNIGPTEFAWNNSELLANLTWNSTGLTYLNLQTTPGAAQRTGALDQNTGNFTYRRFLPAGTIEDGTFYFSYLYQQSAMPEVDPAAYQLETDSIRITSNINGVPKFFVRHDGSNPTDPQTGQLMGTYFGNAVNTASTVGLDLSKPVLIVGVITQDTTHDINNNIDTFTLYFNPSDLSDVPGTAAVTLVAEESFGNGLASWDAIGGLGFDGGPRDNIWDEFRIAWGPGASIADVVPVVPEPASYALFLGLGAIGLVLRRRLSRNRS